MRLSPSSKTLAYGGDEVNLSVWSIEQALAGKSEASTNDDAKDEKGGKKRKNRELFPGELWRARNEPNDNLDLRQPIQITALAYLSECELVAGNQDGTLRVYDTRSGRRPTAHWKRAMKGSLRSLQSGEVEHQVFAGDAAGTLASFDSRTGRCMYTYRGFASALTALAPIPAFSTTSSAPELLASVGRDRLFRLLSAPKPQADAKKNQEKRGEVLCTEYLPSIPTSVVFAGYGEPVKGSKTGEGEIGRERGEDEEGMEDMGADEEVWEGMQGVGSDEDEAAERRKRRRT
ncbi:hypothetical protein DACRYDRAFT_20134 [Dacryopinax primogenitus]|uniref:Ribosome biogenesis protein NSA1 n=1 Tax=Dacryopinax primogenitus (strain DJM 731) TaxID=1858805 RepID=M5GBH6_DACPD|nr:uncharacterized protein DACRYDRAFT_20134 [Dacryopinax primogenitus]EJU05745.1 hypothetical protein DACRYDRAFT_20134 [Dacryopinax primogenitus]